VVSAAGAAAPGPAESRERSAARRIVKPIWRPAWSIYSTGGSCLAPRPIIRRYRWPCASSFGLSTLSTAGRRYKLDPSLHSTHSDRRVRRVEPEHPSRTARVFSSRAAVYPIRSSVGRAGDLMTRLTIMNFHPLRSTLDTKKGRRPAGPEPGDAKPDVNLPLSRPRGVQSSSRQRTPVQVAALTLACGPCRRPTRSAGRGASRSSTKRPVKKPDRRDRRQKP